jgi:parallel beta-helix repeat protein
VRFLAVTKLHITKTENMKTTKYTVLAISIFFLISYDLFAADIFVSTTGNNNTGNGTIGNPYATIEKACDFVGPGDFIYLRGGIYTGIQHKINPNNVANYGTASNPITVKNYNGEEVILDGTDLDIPNSDGLLHISNWQSPVITYYIIEGLTVRNSNKRGISYYNVENLIIRNCTVHDVQLRAIGGWGHYVTIENNEVYNAGMINENGVMGTGGWPMMIYGAVDWQTGNPSTNLTIKNNYVHNSWGEAMGPGRESSDVIIENNIIRDVFSVGIYIDKATSTTIRGNYLYATDPSFYRFDRPFTAIGWANEENLDGGALPVQDIEIYNNLIEGTGKGINYWHDDSNSDTDNSYHNITIVYNTIVDVTHYAISLDEVPSGNTPPSGCIFKNNIVENGSQSNYVDNESAWTFSHNCWVDGVPYFDGSSTSFQGQPSFVNPSTIGGFTAYKLTSWSECLDAGTAITGITTDYWGNSRDGSHPAIGMHEPTFSVYYVDGAVSSSGDGQSWATAKKTVSEAANLNLNPGEIVYIRPGTYPEDVAIESNGSQIVGITANVTVSASNKITFPSGTDLSSIDLNANPEEYYAYVYRSWKSNNGYFKITKVDDANDFVIVEGSDFIYEAGVSGNLNYLSAAIGRPVVYKKYSNDPENERVMLDCSTVPSAYTILYIGDYIDPYDANPANFNIIDGLDVTNSEGGIHLQSSGFNVLANGRSYATNESPGLLIHGNLTHPANYNLIINYEIFDIYGEGIYLGKGGGTQIQNHTHYNHIIGNEIYMSQQSDVLENAIDLKEYNVGNVIESNIIHSFKLWTESNGALDIRNEANHALVYNNTFKNILGTASSGDTEYILNVYPETENMVIFNNLIYRTSANQDYVYAANLEGENTSGNYFVHNTIYNIDLGILVQNYGTGVDFTIANNIINGVRDELIMEWTTTGSQEGHFTFQNNLFNADPSSSFYPVTSEFIGDPNFTDAANGDFNLTTSSTKALDKGTSLNFPNLDFALTQRDATADLGAYEYLPTTTHTWTGNESADWNIAANWNEETIPGSSSVVIIPNDCENYPQVSNAASSPATVDNLNIEGGATIEVLPGGCLTVSGFLRNYNGKAGTVVNSDATGTGSLIVDQPVLATVQRYISAWTSDLHGWHFLASPVVGQNIQPEFVPDPPTAGQDFFKWDEPTATWINTKMEDGGNLIWNSSFEDNFVVGRGYLTAFDNDQTRSFEQTLNVEDVTHTNLSRSGGDYSGWHLLGNPFSSAIKWNDGNWNLANIAGTAKIWNESGKSYSDIAANGIIPAAQGFFVQAGAAANSITIPANSRLHDAQAWYKNADQEMIVLVASPLDGSSFQETTIIFNPSATAGFDFNFDSPFRPGYAPEFYSIVADRKLSTNALPSCDPKLSISLGFQKNQHNQFIIQLVEKPFNMQFFLFDIKENLQYDLGNSNAYVFESEADDAPERFLLFTFPISVDEVSYADGFDITISGKVIRLQSSKYESGLVSVFNVAGQKVYESRVAFSEDPEIILHSAAGWHIIRILGNDGLLSRKIFIH